MDVKISTEKREELDNIRKKVNDIANLKNKVGIGDCYETGALAFFGINYSVPAGVTCKSDLYG